jgi:acetyl-CoA carboxylase carboxyltransferase component
MSNDRDELTRRLDGLEATARNGEPKAVARQHAQGKLTARERVERLMDDRTFVEDFLLAESPSTEFGMAERKKPGDGVITGYGKVAGRLTYVFAQDFTSFAGTVGSVHAEKIAYTIETARKVGAPVVGLYDSAGARIQEGLDVTKSIGKLFYQNTITSGVVPQISAIMGPCIGVAAYSPALTDIIVMVEGTSQMFITGPGVVQEVTGEDVTMDQLGGAKVHSETSGVSDLVADTDEDCISRIQVLLGYLPPNNRVDAPVKESGDDPQRRVDDVEQIVPDNVRKPYDIREVIRSLVDDASFEELKVGWARNIVIGFGRLDGRSVGFVANQPMFLAGSLDVDCSDKASRFIRLCDAYNIPIVTLVDVPGYMPGTEQERMGIIRHGAKMLYAYAESTVPKITIYLRKGYGGAKQAMCTHEMGADQVFVWPGVELAVMGAAGAVRVLYKREIEQAENPDEVRKEKLEEFNQRFIGPFEAVRKRYANAAIRPGETHIRLIQSLEMLANKVEDRPHKKHGIMPV